MAKCNDTIQGTTTANNLMHIYSFRHDDYQSNLIELNACNSKFDTVVALYDIFGNLMAYNDDNDLCGHQSILQYMPLTGGDYLIGITGYENEYGTYSLQISCSFIRAQCMMNIFKFAQNFPSNRMIYRLCR